MSEIADAVQIIRVTYDGVEIALRVGSGSVKVMQKTLKFLYGMLGYEKQMGRTSMRKLLMRGGDLQVLQFDKKDLKKVKKYAKKYGILYAALPEMGEDRDKMEVLFHSEAVSRMNLLLQKLNGESCKVRFMDKFLEEADDKEISSFDNFLKKQQKGNHDANADKNLTGLLEKVGQYAVEKKSVSVDEIQDELAIDKETARDTLEKLLDIGVVDKPDGKDTYRVMMDREAFDDRIRRFREISERMRMVAASKNTDLSDITITRKLVAEENDLAVKTRIPGTWGADARYIWIRKSDIMKIHGGKTLLTFIDMEKPYKLYTKDNRVAGTMKGDVLYSRHYDAVSEEIRKRKNKDTSLQRRASHYRKTR